jgi:gamma-glutamyltranspeptidase/glutathione hydrolase
VPRVLRRRGGGHAIYFDAATGRARNLDCFVTVPGLAAGARHAELLELDIPFGEELVHYAVGVASCSVPGLPAGLDELWRWYGRLPWDRVVEPALRLARSGVDMTDAQASCLAMLAPVMTMDAGARIYAPGGELLRSGDRLEQPGLASLLEVVAQEGAATVYSGSIADSLVGLMEERGGLVTREDLAVYAADWSDPVAVSYARARLLVREGLSGVPETVRRLPRFRGRSEPERAVLWAKSLESDPLPGDTTNVSAVDADGNACVLTTSLGLGSGDFLPGFDLHLNSMLGEAELLRTALEPGDRMGSMMAPTVAIDGQGLLLAAGAAGGTRLRGALLQSLVGVIEEGLRPAAAVERPRLHPIGRIVHLEPGWSPEAIDAIEAAGFETKVWDARHHFFGGVSMVGRQGAGADPRRSGVATSI